VLQVDSAPYCSNQEQWMKDLHPLKRRKDEGTLHKIEWENGS
jgi:hypothetical protein